MISRDQAAALAGGEPKRWSPPRRRVVSYYTNRARQQIAPQSMTMHSSYTQISRTFLLSVEPTEKLFSMPRK